MGGLYQLMSEQLSFGKTVGKLARPPHEHRF
jgi:hypothetical protein